MSTTYTTTANTIYSLYQELSGSYDNRIGSIPRKDTIDALAFELESNYDITIFDDRIFRVDYKDGKLLFRTSFSGLTINADFMEELQGIQTIINRHFN